MEKRKTLTPHQPVEVAKDAAFMENSVRGDKVDLRKLAGADLAPQGRRAVSSARARSSSCAIRTSGWINASIYRVQVHGRNKRHGPVRSSRPARRDHREEILGQGQACPVAVVNGEDPALFIAGFEYLPAGQSEYDFAGAIKGAPIEVLSPDR